MQTRNNRNSKEILDELITRYPTLAQSRTDIEKAYEVLKEAFESGGKLLLAGNGGSASDSDHISGELTKSFFFKRRIPDCLHDNLCSEFGDEGRELASNLEGGLPAIPLTVFNAANSAFANDTNPKVAFAQLVNAIGNEKDVFLGITTSGNSANIVYALMVAKAKGMHTILLTGGTGGKCRNIAEVSIIVGEKETFKVQELHLPVYHALCLMVESELFDGIDD